MDYEYATSQPEDDIKQETVDDLPIGADSSFIDGILGEGVDYDTGKFVEEIRYYGAEDCKISASATNLLNKSVINSDDIPVEEYAKHSIQAEEQDILLECVKRMEACINCPQAYIAECADNEDVIPEEYFTRFLTDDRSVRAGTNNRNLGAFRLFPQDEKKAQNISGSKNAEKPTYDINISRTYDAQYYESLYSEAMNLTFLPNTEECVSEHSGECSENIKKTDKKPVKDNASIVLKKRGTLPHDSVSDVPRPRKKKRTRTPISKDIMPHLQTVTEGIEDKKTVKKNITKQIPVPTPQDSYRIDNLSQKICPEYETKTTAKTKLPQESTIDIADIRHITSKETLLPTLRDDHIAGDLPNIMFPLYSEDKTDRSVIEYVKDGEVLLEETCIFQNMLRENVGEHNIIAHKSPQPTVELTVDDLVLPESIDDLIDEVLLNNLSFSLSTCFNEIDNDELTQQTDTAMDAQNASVEYIPNPNITWEYVSAIPNVKPKVQHEVAQEKVAAIKGNNKGMGEYYGNNGIVGKKSSILDTIDTQLSGRKNVSVQNKKYPVVSNEGSVSNATKKNPILQIDSSNNAGSEKIGNRPNNDSVRVINDSPNDRAGINNCAQKPFMARDTNNESILPNISGSLAEQILHELKVSMGEEEFHNICVPRIPDLLAAQEKKILGNVPRKYIPKSARAEDNFPNYQANVSNSAEKFLPTCNANNVTKSSSSRRPLPARIINSDRTAANNVNSALTMDKEKDQKTSVKCIPNRKMITERLLTPKKIKPEVSHDVDREKFGNVPKKYIPKSARAEHNFPNYEANVSNSAEKFLPTSNANNVTKSSSSRSPPPARIINPDRVAATNVNSALTMDKEKDQKTSVQCIPNRKMITERLLTPKKIKPEVPHDVVRENFGNVPKKYIPKSARAEHNFPNYEANVSNSAEKFLPTSNANNVTKSSSSRSPPPARIINPDRVAATNVNSALTMDKEKDQKTSVKCIPNRKMITERLLTPKKIKPEVSHDVVREKFGNVPKKYIPKSARAEHNFPNYEANVSNSAEKFLPTSNANNVTKSSSSRSPPPARIINPDRVAATNVNSALTMDKEKDQKTSVKCIPNRKMITERLLTPKKIKPEVSHDVVREKFGNVPKKYIPKSARAEHNFPNYEANVSNSAEKFLPTSNANNVTKSSSSRSPPPARIINPDRVAATNVNSALTMDKEKDQKTSVKCIPNRKMITERLLTPKKIKPEVSHDVVREKFGNVPKKYIPKSARAEHNFLNYQANVSNSAEKFLPTCNANNVTKSSSSRSPPPARIINLDRTAANNVNSALTMDKEKDQKTSVQCIPNRKMITERLLTPKKIKPEVPHDVVREKFGNLSNNDSHYDVANINNTGQKLLRTCDANDTISSSCISSQQASVKTKSNLPSNDTPVRAIFNEITYNHRIGRMPVLPGTFPETIDKVNVRQIPYIDLLNESPPEEVIDPNRNIYAELASITSDSDPVEEIYPKRQDSSEKICTMGTVFWMIDLLKQSTIQADTSTNKPIRPMNPPNYLPPKLKHQPVLSNIGNADSRNPYHHSGYDGSGSSPDIIDLCDDDVTTLHKKNKAKIVVENVSNVLVCKRDPFTNADRNSEILSSSIPTNVPLKENLKAFPTSTFQSDSKPSMDLDQRISNNSIQVPKLAKPRFVVKSGTKANVVKRPSTTERPAKNQKADEVQMLEDLRK